MAREDTKTAPLSALCLHAGDDVGVVTRSGAMGQSCVIHSPEGLLNVTLATDVPFGHKVSLRSIKSGAIVVKYGQPIGIAASDIPAGSHVHVHNLSGLRCTEEKRDA